MREVALLLAGAEEASSGSLPAALRNLQRRANDIPPVLVCPPPSTHRRAREQDPGAASRRCQARRQRGVRQRKGRRHVGGRRHIHRWRQRRERDGNEGGVSRRGALAANAPRWSSSAVTEMQPLLSTSSRDCVSFSVSPSPYPSAVSTSTSDPPTLQGADASSDFQRAKRFKVGRGESSALVWAPLLPERRLRCLPGMPAHHMLGSVGAHFPGSFCGSSTGHPYTPGHPCTPLVLHFLSHLMLCPPACPSVCPPPAEAQPHAQLAAGTHDHQRAAQVGGDRWGGVRCCCCVVLFQLSLRRSAHRPTHPPRPPPLPQVFNGHAAVHGGAARGALRGQLSEGSELQRVRGRRQGGQVLEWYTFETTRPRVPCSRQRSQAGRRGLDASGLWCANDTHSTYLSLPTSPQVPDQHHQLRCGVPGAERTRSGPAGLAAGRRARAAQHHTSLLSICSFAPWQARPPPWPRSCSTAHASR